MFSSIDFPKTTDITTDISFQGIYFFPLPLPVFLPSRGCTISSAQGQHVGRRHYGKGAPQQMQSFHSRMVAYAGTPEITVKHLGYMHH
eukprot:5203660-Amphidinium_carterae.1